MAATGEAGRLVAGEQQLAGGEERPVGVDGRQLRARSPTLAALVRGIVPRDEQAEACRAAARRRCWRCECVPQVQPARPTARRGDACLRQSNAQGQSEHPIDSIDMRPPMCDSEDSCRGASRAAPARTSDVWTRASRRHVQAGAAHRKGKQHPVALARQHATGHADGMLSAADYGIRERKRPDVFTPGLAAPSGPVCTLCRRPPTVLAREGRPRNQRPLYSVGKELS